MSLYQRRSTFRFQTIGVKLCRDQALERTKFCSKQFTIQIQYNNALLISLGENYNFCFLLVHNTYKEKGAEETKKKQSRKSVSPLCLDSPSGTVETGNSLRYKGNSSILRFWPLVPSSSNSVQSLVHQIIVSEGVLHPSSIVLQLFVGHSSVI